MGIVIMALKPLACESTAWRGRQVVPGELLSCGRFRYTRSRSVRCLFRRSDDRNRHYLPTRTDSHTATNKEPQETILEINNQPPDQQPTPRSTTNPEINNQPQKYPGRATPAQTHQHHSATLQNSTGSVARSGDNWFYPTAASSGGISWLRAHPIRPAVLCAPVVEASSSSAVTPNTACTPSTHARCFPARVNSRERTIGV